jgi:hypothetical protein
MHGTDLISVASAGAAAASAVAACGAWRAAFTAGRATEALTAIEAERRWQELMPTFITTFTPLNSTGPAIHLDIELVGPLALQRVDSLTVRVRDDRPGRDQVGAARPRDAAALEQLKAQVWGPYRFTPHVGPDGHHRADGNGRQVDVGAPLEVGEGLRFQLEPTRPPAWMHADGVDAGKAEEEWSQMVGSDIRLTITAQARGLQPWVVPIEINAAKPKVVFG